MGYNISKCVQPAEDFPLQEVIAIKGIRFAKTEGNYICRGHYQTLEQYMSRIDDSDNSDNSSIWVKQSESTTLKDKDVHLNTNGVETYKETVFDGPDSDEIVEFQEVYCEGETHSHDWSTGRDHYTLIDDAASVENGKAKYTLSCGGLQNIPPAPPSIQNIPRCQNTPRSLFGHKRDVVHNETLCKPVDTSVKKHECLEYEEMVAIFKPLIVKNLNVKEILPHLPFLEDHEDHYETAKTSPKGAVLGLLSELTRSKEIGKWYKFIEALSDCGYEYIVKNIRGYSFIDLKYQETYLKTLSVKLSRMIRPIEILANLIAKDVISDTDKEEIEKEYNNHGNIAAANLLLNRIPRKHSKWYVRFLEVLRETGFNEAADDLDIPQLTKTNRKPAQKQSKIPQHISQHQLQSNNVSESTVSELYHFTNSDKSSTHQCEIVLVHDNEYDSRIEEEINYLTGVNDRSYEYQIYEDSLYCSRTSSSRTCQPIIPFPPPPQLPQQFGLDKTNYPISKVNQKPSNTEIIVGCETPPPIPKRMPKSSHQALNGESNDRKCHDCYITHLPLSPEKSLKAHTTDTEGQRTGYECQEVIVGCETPTPMPKRMPKSSHQVLNGESNDRALECQRLEKEIKKIDEELKHLDTIHKLNKDFNRKLKKKMTLSKNIALLTRESEALRSPIDTGELAQYDDCLELERAYQAKKCSQYSVPASDHGIY